MATDKQLQANRRNAQKSTGPRTAAGKSISRWNALKEGIYARALALPGEDAQARAALDQSFRSAYRPANPIECAHVDALAAAEWQLRRCRRLEAAFFQLCEHPADAFLKHPMLLNRILTGEVRASRLYHRTLFALIHRQSVRRAVVQSPLACEIGFVPKNRDVRASNTTAKPNWLRSKIQCAPTTEDRALDPRLR